MAPAIAHGAVPVARRQLLHEPVKLAVAALAVAAAVALVLLLTGLRRGIGEQVTTYLSHQPPVLVGQVGTRNFVAQTSVLPDATLARVAAVPGVARVDPIAEGLAMLTLHGRRVLTVLIGYDEDGGPWSVAKGRAPRARNELVLDRVLADEHGLRVGSVLRFRGAELRIVGLSSGTSGFMTPLAFTTLETADALRDQPGTATFLLVRPAPRVAPSALATRIDRAVPGVTARLRDELAASDRNVFVGAFSTFLDAMVSLSSAVAVLVIGLTVYSSTRERAREYATLKALGLTRRSLLRLVAVQSGALALAGTALGLVLSLAAVRGIAAVAPKYLIAIEPRDAVLMALASLAFALLAGLAPARYLARLDPATAFHR
jgi:putative ABC transport system permease protein